MVENHQLNAFETKVSKLKWKQAHLENHDLPVIGLQVEGPGGGDEALGGAHDVVAPAGHGLHDGGGLGPQRHGSELQGWGLARQAVNILTWTGWWWWWGGFSPSSS